MDQPSKQVMDSKQLKDGRNSAATTCGSFPFDDRHENTKSSSSAAEPNSKLCVDESRCSSKVGLPKALE
ncbi:hypothetical protein QQ045_013038 [Rhodiola kirilowii]